MIRASGKPDSAQAVWINTSPMVKISSAIVFKKFARWASDKMRYTLNAVEALANASFASSSVASTKTWGSASPVVA